MRSRQNSIPREFGASGGFWQTALPLAVEKLSRGALYLMLQNRVYRGEITHKGNAYPGEHQPIVDEVLWDQVQVILAENRVDRVTRADTKQPSLLAGLIFDKSGKRADAEPRRQEGNALSMRSRSLIVGTAKSKSIGRRIPAANLESLVITKLRSFLADEGAVLNVICEEHVDGAAQSRLIGRGVKIGKEIESLTPRPKTSAMLMTLLSRVDIKPDCVEISVRRSRLVELLGQARSIW